MTPAEELASYVDIWWHSVNDLVAVLEQIPEEKWSTPTDLPGWDVRAVAAHVAHLEGVLATGVEESCDVPEAPHVTGMMGMYTEIGVIGRRDAPAAQIIEEIRSAASTRHDALLADPPTDPDGSPPHMFAGIAWEWRLLLRNRPLDIWMHEQDVRRAVDLPGGMESAAAQHTTDYLIEAFGFVLAKRAAAPVGTIAVLEVEGSAAYAATVGDDGRGAPVVPVPSDPTVGLAMGREPFILLAGGRRPAPPGSVTITGDQALGERLVTSMGTTP